MFEVSNIRSIGIRSAFLLLSQISEISTREGYLVVKTRGNPKYVSANVVIFKDPPEQGGSNRWERVFQEEFADFPEVKAVKLEWDCQEPKKEVLDEFLANGFELEDYLTMVYINPTDVSSPLQGLDIQEVSNEAQWQSIIDQQIYFKPSGLSDEYYSEFYHRLMADYKILLSSGKAKWFIASIAGEVVGSLGILWDEQVARFQRIVVRPMFQGRGVAKQMVSYVSKWVLENLNIHTLVILTENGSRGQKVYESLGFEAKERLLAFYKYPD